MPIKFVAGPDWNTFLGNLTQRADLFVARPAGRDEGPARYRPFAPGDDFACQPCPPPVEPLKAFFFPPREEVARYPGPAPSPAAPGRRVLIGAKACDFRALACLDKIFLAGEFADPFYAGRREQTVLVGTDCARPDEFCFCPLLDVAPWPGPLADLGLAPVTAGLLLEVLSEKGQQLVAAGDLVAAPPSADQLAERESARQAVRAELERANAPWRLPGSRRALLEARLNEPAWNREVASCVECAGCLFSCPTCHCFLLYDQPADSGFARGRNWDACIYAGYGRMAGGGTPRARISERFRHRFLHKFCHFPERFGLEACSGCGRCRRACPGEIDLRSVLRAVAGAEKGQRV